MLQIATLLAVMHLAGPAGRAAAPALLAGYSLPARLAVRWRQATPPGAPWARPSARLAGGGAMAPAACPPDLCPPEPRHPGGPAAGTRRVRRTELFMRLLERSGVVPLAMVGRLYSVVPLRVEWTPPIEESGAFRMPGRGDPGRLTVSLRFALDAHNGWFRPGRGNGR